MIQTQVAFMASIIESKARNIYKIDDNNTYSDDLFEYVYSRRNVKSTKNLIENNLPSSYSSLYENLKRLQSIGCAFTLEKMIICNGEELGKKKYNERKKKYGVTLHRMIEKYGEEEGKKRFKKYCDKQAYVNSYEYKKEKYGMTRKDFDDYNKSRATTLENMIKKYGIEEGTKRFRNYCDKQAYTNSEEYLGKERYEQINKKKAHTLENYIKRHGIEDGTELFKKYVNQTTKSYSKISQELFTSLMQFEIIKGNVYYGKTEYGVLDAENNKYFKYDFVAPYHKLCIEFHGDHYHGNPKLYRPNDFLSGKGCTKIRAKDKWILDQEKIDLLKRVRNFDTIVVWELDYRKSKENVIERILNYVKNKV